MTPRLIVLGGSTGVGKTAIAVDLAMKLNAEIVGADSVQIYRGFDIGSAKPTTQELRGVSHHMIDVADPNEAFDAMRYAQLSDVVIREIHERNKIAIVAGGTGLWLRALLRGLAPLPPVDPALRQRLYDEARTLGNAHLHRQLASVDPRAASSIHVQDTLRIVRALEIYQQTGQTASAWWQQDQNKPARYDSHFVWIDLPRPILRERLAHRSRQMLEAGWIEECDTLITRWGPDVRAMQSVGYRVIRDWILEKQPFDREQLLEKIVIDSGRYAKRQQTWFQGEPLVTLRITPAELMTNEQLEAMRRFMLQQ